MNAPQNSDTLQIKLAETPQSPSNRKLYAGLAVAAAAIAVAAFAVPAWLDHRMNSEQTEDAYVDGNVVQVTPQLAGTVTHIGADNTDFVSAGQTLIELNPIDAQVARERAEAALSKAVRQVRAQFASAGQSRAGLAQRASDLARAEADLARRRNLGASGAISGEDLHHAEDAVEAARAAYDAASQQVAAAHVQVEGTTVATHPDVLNAAAQLRDAYMAEARTHVSAPASGIVARRNVQIGQRVAPGAPLMSIVPLDRLWVSANFKESQLRNLRIGQKATITADTYGGKVTYTGHVFGQEAGTGSAFSLLPAQNATGNWIKVVQRVPVRIALDAAELASHPLRLGLSMQVEVDTSDQSGPVLSAAGLPRQEYKTEVFAQEAQAADAAVQQALQLNLAAGAGRHAGIALR